jgi:hypothetical protein
VTPDIVSAELRAQLLDETIRDEVDGGAGVEHRDRFSAILVRGSERALVVVDEGGGLHVERMRRRARRSLPLMLLVAGSFGTLLLSLVLSLLDIRRF